MSTVKANNHQIGQSGTATNNFTLYQPSTPDGTVRLAVGNSGATTGDVLSVSNTGLSVTGTLSATGNVTLGDATTDTITLTGTVQPGVVISGSSSGDALRITQTGAGNALLVEDDANPDSTPFVVTAAGNVGIGTSSPVGNLHVSNSTASVKLLLTRTGSSGNTQMGFENSAGTRYMGVFSDRFIIGTSADLSSSAQATLDSSGNLGIGAGTSSFSQKLEVSGGAAQFNGGGIDGTFGDAILFGNTTYPAVQKNRIRSSISASGVLNLLSIETSTGTTGAYNSNQLVLVGDGNVGIGTNSPSSILDVQKAGTAAATTDLLELTNSGNASSMTNTGTGILFNQFYYSATTPAVADAGRIAVKTEGNWTSTATTQDAYMTFETALDGTVAERARITSGGYFKASNSGTYAGSTASYNEFYQTNNSDTVRVTNTSSAVSGAYGVYVDLTTDPNATDSFFLRCYGGANQRASIRSNGGLANYQANDVNLSDQRVKKDIAPAPSYWDKIKGIEIVHFKYKDQTHDDNNVGVIAQQVEQVAPEFVDQDGWGETPEDGVPLKSIYTSDMYHAAIKALQEAMTRIETLEAKVAALKGTQP